MSNNEVSDIKDPFNYQSGGNQENTEGVYSQNHNSRSNEFQEDNYICCVECKKMIDIGKEVYIINNQIYCHKDKDKDCFDSFFDSIKNKIKQNYTRIDTIVNNKKNNRNQELPIQESPITLDLGDNVLEIKKKIKNKKI